MKALRWHGHGDVHVDTEIDPSFVVTHKVKLGDAPKMYETFRDKKDGRVKVVIQP
jgi:threonine dehydrogenase-like Zn-dependent dehydrogenase